jgi:hypothetical protein
VTDPAEAFDEAAFAERRVLGFCEAALERAGVAGVLPTPLEPVIEVAGIKEILDISDLPNDIPRPRALARILGAVHFRHKTAFIDRSQSHGRVKWIEAHEATHSILPWHSAQAFLDDDETLFRTAEEEREREANIGAAHLIFQGGRFFEQAMDYEHSIKTPILLSDSFGASMHATIRYYAERHPEPMALAICGRLRWRSGHVPIYDTFESPAFYRTFGKLRGLLPTTGFPVEEGAGNDGLAAIAEAALSSSDEVACETRLARQEGGESRFRVEAFHNQHSLFILFTRRRGIVRLGRRIDLESG